MHSNLLSEQCKKLPFFFWGCCCAVINFLNICAVQSGHKLCSHCKSERCVVQWNNRTWISFKTNRCFAATLWQPKMKIKSPCGPPGICSMAAGGVQTTLRITDLNSCFLPSERLDSLTLTRCPTDKRKCKDYTFAQFWSNSYTRCPYGYTYWYKCSFYLYIT